MPERATPDEIREILRQAETIAVLGASSKTQRPGHYVPRYLHDAGYEIIPVNPEISGETLFGRAALDHLTEIDVPVDVVDVFRRSSHLPGHLDDILAMDPLPKVVWFQQGIRNDEVAAALIEAGIDVVQDRCMLADHQRLL
jgi:predicted CoA-binding protein